jgi:hypothetical protein
MVHTACIKPGGFFKRQQNFIHGNSGILTMFSLVASPRCQPLSESKKGYFPHFSNTEENQNYMGPFPAAYYYNPDDM